MDGTNIKKSEALGVLSMKIQCEVCWNRHIFSALSSYNGTSSSDLLLYTTYTRKRMVHNSHVEDDASMSMLTLMTVGYPTLLIYCNIVAIWIVSLCYRYSNGFCLSKIRGLRAVNHEFLYNTRLSWQAHSYVGDWPVDRTLHGKQNSFSSRTIRMLNSSRAEVVIF